MSESSPPSLLLLHGLGAARGVWQGTIEATEWPGRIIAPDLSGHGEAAPGGDYTVGGLAAEISKRELENGERILIAGHSLGGAVGLCLASGFFGPEVVGVVGIGIKVSWSDQDVAGMAKLAARGDLRYPTRDEAAQRFLRQAGLVDVIDDQHPLVDQGIRAVDDEWWVNQDPMTWAQRPLDMAGLMAAATCPVILGAGEHDAMVGRDDLAAFTDDVRIAIGHGHNVQVESPTWVAELIRELAAKAD